LRILHRVNSVRRLKPDKMLAYGVSADDVIDALARSNVEAAPGKIGENSDRADNPLQYTVKYTGKFNSEGQYENIPIKATSDGEILRIKDVALVEFGTTYFDVEAKFNGRPAASILLKQLPGSNASEVIAAVKERLATLKQEVFLPGMDYQFSYDVSRFLDASVAEVLQTLLEAFVLVALVVFLFLQDARSTLIPTLAVPVSLVGVFFFIQFLGFSLNLITLFALVLAIGIVVDDAIVVVEAVHAKMAETSLGPREATDRAMEEIGGAILAITLVMTSVFLPVAFIQGPSGIFYRQFSLTMAIAIALSGLVALTLTPALCATILRRHDGHAGAHSGMRRFFDWFNRGYTSIEGSYASLLRRVAFRRSVTFALLVLFAIGTGLVSRVVPKGFIPSEDQGFFYVSVTTPPGATLERTKRIVDAIQRAGQGVEGIESIATLSGTNILSDGTGATYGTCLVNLKPWHDRRLSADEVMRRLGDRTRDLQGADIEFFSPPSVPGYGNASGFELRLLDKSGSGDFNRMQDVVDQFIQDLKATPEIGSAFTIYNPNFPQYLVEIDMDKAAQKGVSVDGALGNLQTLLGSEYATNFIRFGQMYKVMVQALPEYRAKPEDVLKLYVRNDQGAMVPLSSFVKLTKTHGIDQMTRYNMYPSAELNGDGKPGVSSGEVLSAIQRTARQNLPRGYSIDWAGISRDEVNAGNEGAYVFLICLIFVFLVLTAQYESLVLPLAVLLSVPPGVFGAFACLKLAGLENDLYTHIALVMLIGLLGKNGILIVEYAELKRAEGASPLSAVIEAARLRLRPILMTSFAFVVGLLPLVFASGAGAAGNRTIGTAAAGGMLIGTLWGIVLVPGLYVLFSQLRAGSKPQCAEPAGDRTQPGPGVEEAGSPT
jgi:HAE1 family hydrophobic/amphiphilic exporter-1